MQRAVFPAYFGIQTVAPVVLALTYPGGGGRLAALPQGISGVLHPANRWGVLVPLTASFVTGLANWAYFLPETNKITAQRRQQGTCLSRNLPCDLSYHLSVVSSRCAFFGLVAWLMMICIVEVKDGNQSWEKTAHSKDMKALNRKFAKIHGYSSLFNLITFIATVVYGVQLSARIV